MITPEFPDRPELNVLIKVAAMREMSPREVWLQRVNFAFGLLPEESTTTIEQIAATATEMYGPCPPEPPARHVPIATLEPTPWTPGQYQQFHDYMMTELCGVYGCVRSHAPLEMSKAARFGASDV